MLHRSQNDGEKHLEKLEEHCKPRGSKLVVATQYKVLTQGDMDLLEYSKLLGLSKPCAICAELRPEKWTKPSLISHLTSVSFCCCCVLRIIPSYAFLWAVDEELEMKPKKRRKRTRELPKEYSSDDGNIHAPTDVNAFYIASLQKTHKHNVIH